MTNTTKKIIKNIGNEQVREALRAYTERCGADYNEGLQPVVYPNTTNIAECVEDLLNGMSLDEEEKEEQRAFLTECAEVESGCVIIDYMDR